MNVSAAIPPVVLEVERETGRPWPVDYNSYTILGKVGQGAFASVWRAECSFDKTVENDMQTGRKLEVATTTVNHEKGEERKEGDSSAAAPELCAIKVLDLEQLDTNFSDIRLEVQTMILSSHPNILSIYTSFIQSSNLWLVMQLMDKGSSLHCLQSIRVKYHRNNYNPIITTGDGEEMTRKEIIMEDHITYILHETLLGLKYIHDNGQIHRDVKAGNILLDSNGNARIADFGVSGWLVHGGSKRENTRTFVGTPCWMAPEVMEQIHGYDTKADIWSVGITALELAKGYAPYAKYPPMKVLLQTIREDPPSLDTYLNYDDEFEDDLEEEDRRKRDNRVILNEEWSQSFQSMIKMCLQKSPTQRPNCEELLQHEHFQPLSDENKRYKYYRRRIKSEICDQIENVGMNKQVTQEGKKKGQQSSSSVPVSVLNTENIPEGTTWVFEDGSQVTTAHSSGSVDTDDNQDFLNKFEDATQGENFRRPSTIAEETIKERDTNDRDGINAFMDEFEKMTSGENATRK